MCDLFVFFKQKTAYEMRISDWSSDVCSSDLDDDTDRPQGRAGGRQGDGDDGRRSVDQAETARGREALFPRGADQGSALCPDAGERRYAADVAERRTHGAVQARTGQAVLRSAALRVVSRTDRNSVGEGKSGQVRVEH